MKIIKFGKEGCAPCIALDAWLEQKGIKEVIKVNPFEDVELGIKYEIKTVPTLILKDGDTIIKKVVGGIDRNVKMHEELIRIYKELGVNGKRYL